MTRRNPSLYSGIPLKKIIGTEYSSEKIAFRKSRARLSGRFCVSRIDIPQSTRGRYKIVGGKKMRRMRDMGGFACRWKIDSSEKPMANRQHPLWPPQNKQRIPPWWTRLSNQNPAVNRFDDRLIFFFPPFRVHFDGGTITDFAIKYGGNDWSGEKKKKKEKHETSARSPWEVTEILIFFWGYIYHWSFEKDIKVVERKENGERLDCSTYTL